MIFSPVINSSRTVSVPCGTTPGVKLEGRGGRGRKEREREKGELLLSLQSPLPFSFLAIPPSYPRGQKYSVISALSKLFLSLFYNEFNFSNSQLYCNWGYWYPFMRTNLRSVHAILHHLHNHVVFPFSCIRRFFRGSLFFIAKLYLGNKEVEVVG